MTTQKDHKLNVESTQQLTKEQLLRYRQAREKIDSGVIASQTPPPRDGMHQRITTKDNLKKTLELFYSHRLDDQGNACTIEDSKGEKLYVMEIPIQLWEESVKYQNAEAQKPLQELKRYRSFREDSDVFSSGADISTGSRRFPK